jgi:hypothetical protein
MKNNNKIHENFAESGWARLTRLVLVALGTGAAVLLATTMEIGNLHAQVTGFTFKGALLRVITPNNDKKNDIAILCIENPKDSGISGKVFDLRGHLVSGMVRENNTSGGAVVTNCNSKFPSVGGTGGLAQPEGVTWDGKSGGRAVSAGVYIYQIKSEDVTVTGTIVVVR